MCMSDPIADMLTRIRNACSRKAKKVAIPYSKLKHNLADVLVKEGFIENVCVENLDGSEHKKNLVLVLKYHGQNKRPVCATIRRVSKPGLRRYAKASDTPRNGFGICVISTSKGLMSDHDARRHNLGGEILCKVSTLRTEE